MLLFAVTQPGCHGIRTEEVNTYKELTEIIMQVSIPHMKG